MKFVLLGIIFASICSLGFKFSGTYKQKERFYQDFYSFLLYVKSQIFFLKTSLIEILEDYKTDNKDLKFLLNNFKNSLSQNCDFKLDILSDDENLEIKNFLNGLGKNDCFSQNDYLENNLDFFNKKFIESQSQNLKYGAVYKKLGIIFAFFIVILLI